MKWSALLLAACAAVLGLTAGAAPFAAATVPEAALWVCHVDAAALKASEAGGLLLARPEWKVSPATREFTGRFGLDPAADVRGLTLYMTGTGRLDGVAVIEPEPAAAARLPAWRARTGWKPLEAEGRTLFSRAAGPDTLYQGVASNGLLVTGLALERVLAGLAVLDGRAPALTVGSLPALADRNGGAGALLLAAARSPDPGLMRLAPQLSLLKNADGLCLALGEKDGRVSGGLTVTAADAAEAERLEKTLAALVEIGRSLAAPGGGEALKAVAIGREGGMVRADWSASANELLKLMGYDKAPGAVQQ